MVKRAVEKLDRCTALKGGAGEIRENSLKENFLGIKNYLTGGGGRRQIPVLIPFASSGGKRN